MSCRSRETPKWCELYGIDGKGSMGEVLVSFQLIEMKSIDQVIPIPDDITPSLRKAYIDVHVIGLRDLTNKGKSKSIKKPFLQLDIANQSKFGESFKLGKRWSRPRRWTFIPFRWITFTWRAMRRPISGKGMIGINGDLQTESSFRLTFLGLLIVMDNMGDSLRVIIIIYVQSHLIYSIKLI